ncbi:inverse autotransporter beta domain-containing protein [Gilliamella sp. B2776]|uniref:inverse autotransporter beta domain-containing protein n=1 Tax=unclassified Gilliamella TaxID=2685620 RepID=UPI00226A12AC|nr:MULTISPECIES: inverse autotransporter beta domain-containing protein [unclassified Gilliamella]MCX8648801.1 inverse autotransporter beta domain-containing protein [Gilliamella sp. B2779]MCX8653323.1 inverse autotransporter beta domain-containing protein [Gilliamella sp. B2737]MCX8655599.1 inverse autotransporter beta domain-containing protein [Gilliamella sp. B2894]MCX8664349.1 inverse autotransporter beta domain-containing protein [Gilliamella sp. B2887]MCX8690613.1 inverse autotransporter
MRNNLNLKVISTLVIMALGCQTSWAVDNTVSKTVTAVDSNKVIELKNGTKVREMVNNQQRSLYQIALLSGVSISELREINAGRYDKKDLVEVGERLVLPENSPILPAMKKSDSENQDKYANLPKLGSDDNYDTKADKDALASQVASTLQTLATQDWKQITSSENGGISGHVKNKAKDYAENYVRNGVRNQVIDPLKGAAQNFLGQFGTAQLQFDVSDTGSFNNINAKLFSPWYDTEDFLIFTQLSFQEYEHNRRIGNFGIGQRWDVADKTWLLGYNVFLDHDFQRSHNRLGIGAEAWTDYMKFAVNYYHPLSDWKDSKDFDDYLERAARGFDIRFQGYLPQYPHLGGSLMYEQYYGDKVALFGKDNLQKDPRAVTASVDYTPVPLFTVKAEHKRGQDSNKATKAELTMNYRIGVPLKDQMDPDMVQVARSVKGSRYDLVDRNNYIVLEYKEKKMSVDLGLESLQLLEGETYGVSIGVHNAKGIRNVSWSGDMMEIDAGGGFFCFATGTCNSSNWLTPRANINNWKIVAPSYVDSAGQRRPVSTKGKYTLAVTVTDEKGKSATSNSISFEVLPNPIMRKVGVWVIDENGNKTSMAKRAADGKSSITILATLFKPKGDIKAITSENDIEGFSDDELMNSIPNNFASVLKGWSATSNGKKVTLIDGTSGNVDVCPSQEPCVIVKSFEKVKKGQKVSSNAATAADIEVIGDSYILDVASNLAGAVDFAITIDRFGTSFNKATIDFIGGKTNTIKVYRADGVLVAENKGDSLEFDPTGIKEWQVDSEYYVKGYGVDGQELPDPFVIWSLVGSNEQACPGSAATSALPSHKDNPNGPWFNVAMGTGAHYTIRSKKTFSYATVGKGIDVVAGAPAHLNLEPSVRPSPLACAGDQGFKLQVTITGN